MKRYHGPRNSGEGNHLIEVVVYSFRGLVHYHHWGKQGSMQAADMVLEKEQLHVDTQVKGSRLKQQTVS